MSTSVIWRRFFAHVLDCFIIAFVAMLLFFIATIFSPPPDTITLPTLVVLLTLPFSYYVILESSDKQASFGKRLMDIKVVNANGGKSSASRIMIRTLLYFIPVLALLWYLPVFPEKTTVYDLLSGTKVVGS